MALLAKVCSNVVWLNRADREGAAVYARHSTTQDKSGIQGVFGSPLQDESLSNLCALEADALVRVGLLANPPATEIFMRCLVAGINESTLQPGCRRAAVPVQLALPRLQPKSSRHLCRNLRSQLRSTLAETTDEVPQELLRLDQP